MTGGPPGFRPKGRLAPGAEGECFAPYKYKKINCLARAIFFENDALPCQTGSFEAENRISRFHGKSISVIEKNDSG